MLSLLSKIYGAVVAVRNYLFDDGVLESHDLGARTISVGNITAGGTGKTPLVAYIASTLSDQGERVCILTRGYGRADERRRVLVSDGETLLTDAATAGDEPLELAQKLLSKAIVISDADRVAAAEWARRKYDITAFLLDDAFQHRKAKRDLDIVCIDATDPFTRGMIPVGRLREPTQALFRAGVVVITRREMVGDVADLRTEISRLAPHAEIFECVARLDGIRSATGELLQKAQPTFAFCGIGNPEPFFEHLRAAGHNIVGTHAFRDHYKYTQADIRDVERKAAAVNATALVTTAKDAVKIAGFDLTVPLFIAELRIELDREDAFSALLSG